MAAAQAEAAVGVGIIGAGVIGQRLARAVRTEAATLARVVAVCDLNEDAARSLATACGDDCAVLTDFKALIASDAVQVVYVGVPPSLHATMAKAALASGKHVICEKPLTLTGDSSDELAALAVAAKGLSTVNLPFRQMSPIWAMARATNPDGTGYVGTPVRVEIRFRFPVWPRAWQAAPWVGQRFQGGPLREVGTHFYFLMGELFGGITAIRATASFPDDGTARDSRCETSCVGEFKTAAGVPGTLDLLTHVAGDEEVVCRVYGTKGTVTLTNWSELTGQRVASKSRVVSESGSFEGKRGAGGASDEAKAGDADGAAASGELAEGVLAGRDDMTASPEGLLVQRLVLKMRGKEAGHASHPLVTFAQAAAAQRVLDALLLSNGEYRDVKAAAE